MSQLVYRFGNGLAEGNAAMKDLLGGKGANLAEMAAIGLPVPPGFTITTEVCTGFLADRSYPDGLRERVDTSLKHLEKSCGSRFGDTDNPLLVSVRSGGRTSMPGMMDTVLNLGLNDETVEGLARQTGDQRFAWDSYRRFLQMYADVVLGLDAFEFEEMIEMKKAETGVVADTELKAEDWQALCAVFKKWVAGEIGKPFPSDVSEQLWGAIDAVFLSWDSTRAKTYRLIHGIPADWGTAVNVQAMVFGNMGETSATGVAFTRDPANGEDVRYGEFLVNAQGEDVVAGIRTPQFLTRAAREIANADLPSMEEVLPKVFTELEAVFATLEGHYRDMQDVEFTVQQGKLWVLQTRAGKRTAKAALKIAVDMATSGLISEEDAIRLVDPAALDQLLHPTLDPRAARDVLAGGLPASPGAASGKIVFDADTAERMAGEGEDVILVRTETSPEDIHGMHAARGILTSRGGMTSHAAVVARGMGRPCVAGAGEISVNIKDGFLRARGRELRAGDIITIDGSKGQVMVGAVATVEPELTGDFGTLMAWADKVRRMRVRTNAETPEDALTAIGFGAEGIGLCRTEHMFFDAARISMVRQMILADSREERAGVLARLLPLQRSDFEGLFKIMGDRPVTIRLLDPPLHEFLPREASEFEALARDMGCDADDLRRRAGELHEFNPMLGHRGCRLGISYPEIYEMQTEAILTAAANVGGGVMPEIMIPLIAKAEELVFLKKRVIAVAERLDNGVDYQIGTMIELPRAALCAGQIAEHAEFFSFGTNDLTQTALGISRDDSGAFLGDYLDAGIFDTDPFATLDGDGVGELIRMAVERGKAARPNLKLGICGEHGGDPASIHFFERVGLDYVSCSPYRVPIARLAAAQAALDKD